MSRSPFAQDGARLQLLHQRLGVAEGQLAGGEARQPLGLVVVGGLLFSQLVTLYLTPVVYTYMASAQERFGRWRKPKARAATELAPVA